MRITKEQDDALQALYHDYRQLIGDHKLDYHPYYWRPHLMQEFVTWITDTLVANDLLVTVFDMQEKGRKWFEAQLVDEEDNEGLVSSEESTSPKIKESND